MTAAVGPIDPAIVPREVRAGGPEAVARYGAALDFERVLLGELLQTALPEPSGDAGPQPAQLPEAFADALAARGGIGLARSLYEALPAPNGEPPASRTEPTP